MIQPMQVTGADRDGVFNVSACMLFRNALFRTTVRVGTDGTVILQDEELLIEDMPVRDDIFGQ